MCEQENKCSGMIKRHWYRLREITGGIFYDIQLSILSTTATAWLSKNTDIILPTPNKWIRKSM